MKVIIPQSGFYYLGNDNKYRVASIVAIENCEEEYAFLIVPTDSCSVAKYIDENVPPSESSYKIAKYRIVERDALKRFSWYELTNPNDFDGVY